MLIRLRNIFKKSPGGYLKPYIIYGRLIGHSLVSKPFDCFLIPINTDYPIGSFIPLKESREMILNTQGSYGVCRCLSDPMYLSLLPIESLLDRFEPRRYSNKLTYVLHYWYLRLLREIEKFITEIS